MRRIVDKRMLLFAVAVVCMAGCSGPSIPDVADGTNTTEAEYHPALPDAPGSNRLVTDQKVDVPVRLANDPTAVLSEKKPASVEIAEGADSDGPDGYQAPAADEADNSSPTDSQPPNQTVGGNDATKRNGRADGDDPEAPLIIPKIAERQDEAPLNNGRGASVQPIPEGQRVAVASQDLAPESLESGRTPNAKPGAEVANPVKAQPTTKPAAPTRKTLAELSESVQALDKDGDGQLGLYEWPREKLAEFKTLDTNKDGFLTPAELVAGQKKASDVKSPSADKEPAAANEKKAKEKAVSKTDDGSQQDDAKASADSTDKTETSDTSTDEADSNDGASDEEQPAQGN